MKILCPIDLSAHSVSALEYAVNLCNDLDAELHILNAYQIKSTGSTFKSIEKHVLQNTEEDVSRIMAKIKPMIKTGRDPILKITRGSAVSSILSYAEAKDIDLVIMGTQGDNSLRTILFGSVTKKVAAKSKTPILAIPEVVKEKLHSNKVLLALDNKVLENETTFQVPKIIAQTLGLKIDILHVSTEEEEMPFDPYISEYLGDIIGEIYIRQGDDPVKLIKKYAEIYNVGLIIMIRREKSFFTNLFTVGNTSEEVAKTNIPLLILPDLSEES